LLFDSFGNGETLKPRSAPPNTHVRVAARAQLAVTQ
jgi:hypothetical protein